MRARLAAGVVLSLAGHARADMAALVGHGPASIAEAQARVARGDDGAAARENPGGVALGERDRASAGVTLLGAALTVDGARAPIEDPWAVVVAGDATVPLEGALRGRIRVGLGVHAGRSVARVLLPHEATGAQPYFTNRTQRLSVVPALSVRPASWLGVGVAVDALAGVSGAVDASVGRSGAPEPRIDARTPAVVRPIVGVQARPTRALSLGLVVRGRFAVPLLVSTRADVAGVPLEAQTTARQALFDPREVVMAAAWRRRALELELDVGHHAFSAYEGPGLLVAATLPGVDARTPPSGATYRDTWSVGVGATALVGATTLRLGLGLESSMMGPRQVATRLTDGAKRRVGAGLGREVFGARVELGASVTSVAATTVAREVGPGARAGGLLVATSLTVGTPR